MFVNIGGILVIILLIGVLLLFISFGGSLMISLSIVMGLFLIVGK